MKKTFLKRIFKNFIICLWILTQKLIKVRKHREEVVNKKLKQIYTNTVYLNLYKVFLNPCWISPSDKKFADTTT
jgi:hypothetical protein